MEPEDTQIYEPSPSEWTEDVGDALSRALAKGWDEGYKAAESHLMGDEQEHRNPVCVQNWPECESGEYDPKCCRFPKSCSCRNWMPVNPYRT